VNGTSLRRTTAVIAKVMTAFLYAYIIVVEVLLVLAFFLRLFGADPGAGFTDFVYRSVERAMAPFRGIFADVSLGTTSNDVEAVLDTSILFAMLVYGILLLAVGALLDWLSWRIVRLDEREAVERDEARRDAIVQQQMFDRTAEPRVVVTTPPPTDGGVEVPEG
jgi:hypothetical protein